MPTVQTVQETVKKSQVQSSDKVVNTPVAVQQQVPMVQKVQKTDDATQLQVIDEVVRISRQIPMVEKIRKTGETIQMDMLMVTERRVPTIANEED